MKPVRVFTVLTDRGNKVDVLARSAMQARNKFSSTKAKVFGKVVKVTEAKR